MLNRLLQTIFLYLYKIVNATGVLNNSWGRNLFEFTYLFYKKHFEAGEIHLLQSYVKPKSTVIDVGANIGFFTLKFSDWVSEGGKVIAFEPESINYKHLQKNINRANATNVVKSINVAVADRVGEAILELNPIHPGDHKLGKRGIPVKVTTIDHFLEKCGWPEISLIKIDVQGAELHVLNGAIKTLSKYHPVLFVELDDQALIKQGSSANELMNFCTHYGYTLHKLNKDTISSSLTKEYIINHLETTKKYMDILLLPSNSTND